MDTIPNALILHLSKKHDVEMLCNIAGVSISGYYKFKRKHLQGTTKNQREQKEVDRIRKIVNKYNRKYGYRMITMKLKQEGIVMNHKKVLRLMKKYNLLSIIRKKKPYAQMMKATQEHKKAQNILNRKFGGLKAFSKIGTDISYLRFKGKWVYLSIMKDMTSGEVLSHEVSDNLALGFVQDTIKGLKKNRVKGAIIHSDQGFHYTHLSFRIAIEKLGCVQSMSRRGNAPGKKCPWGILIIHQLNHSLVI